MTSPIPSFGATLREDGVEFRMWAPLQSSVDLVIEGRDPLPMLAEAGGWRRLRVDGVGAGARYRFRLPDGLLVPDPASRFQPDDVHGPSEVIDPAAFRWRDGGWRGRSWHECVLYELHIGAFTPEGTFRAAIERLDALAELGVTAIEMMPVADFPGRRNWGYDGVLLFAPDSSYGRPEDLKALIDAAHARGIGVLLDVVYNHFGPDGNYLPLYAPIFNDRHHTPWGGAVNYDADGAEFVRALILQNVAYWIGEYHFDGLRFDAVHAIKDDSATHLLDDIARCARAAAPNRLIHLVLENEENEASRLRRGDNGSPIAFTAQWNDDVHHVLHVAATGENAGYYGEYAGDTSKLGRALAEGFAFQGDMMEYRGHARGEPSADLPPTAFVSFIQNHDQVGNRAFGDRITASAPKPAVRALAAIYLLAPQIPMLFMGEEFAAATPFPFFCDFSGDLAEAVREGRRNEFARFPEFQDPDQRARIPDPTAEATFLSAKLDWDSANHGEHAEWRAFYRELLAIRRSEIVPRLRGIACGGKYRVLGPATVQVDWTLEGGALLTLIANLKADAGPPHALPQGRLLWPAQQPLKPLQPWQVIWILQDG